MDEDRWKDSTLEILNNERDPTYVQCPECSSTLLTKRYKDRYGRCKASYLNEHATIDSRIQNV